ncbi:MAG TPA: FAD-dependent oxidoreductase, partial [Planctomycetaceae bacterium]|nr:FAD-dependent oxidoreductase [Planctomycetaceae bacterium]
MADILVVGGGVVGLSLAWDLASAGASVTLVDAAEVGRAASWAGAGILPPARAESALHPIESLRGLANRLHAEWAVSLREMTGIDTGYRRCGGMYVARTAGEEASLIGLKNLFDEEGIASELLDAAECAAREPRLTPNPPMRRALWTPEECQLRNPRHLRALRVGCQHLGVRIVEHEPIVG